MSEPGFRHRRHLKSVRHPNLYRFTENWHWRAETNDSKVSRFHSPGTQYENFDLVANPQDASQLLNWFCATVAMSQPTRVGPRTVAITSDPRAGPTSGVHRRARRPGRALCVVPGQRPVTALATRGTRSTRAARPGPTPSASARGEPTPRSLDVAPPPSLGPPRVPVRQTSAFHPPSNRGAGITLSPPGTTYDRAVDPAQPRYCFRCWICQGRYIPSRPGKGQVSSNAPRLWPDRRQRPALP